MTVETTKMSSKGQIVIPQSIREEFKIQEGTVFAVVANEDSIILKKMEKPSPDELFAAMNKLAESAKERIEKLGIKESNVVDIIHRRRKIEARSRHQHTRLRNNVGKK